MVTHLALGRVDEGNYFVCFRFHFVSFRFLHVFFSNVPAIAKSQEWKQRHGTQLQQQQQFFPPASILNALLSHIALHGVAVVIVVVVIVVVVVRVTVAIFIVVIVVLVVVVVFGGTAIV